MMLLVKKIDRRIKLNSFFDLFIKNINENKIIDHKKKANKPLLEISLI